MAIMETFIVWGLPVLQSLVATGISHIALKDLYSDDGSDNDAFRKIMREAFADAVRKVRKDSSDAIQKNTVSNEFRYYQKVLIDDLVKFEPIDRKKFIEQDLYVAFKAEVLKREDALQHISMTLTQVAIQRQQEYAGVIDNMHELMVAANRKLDGITEDVQSIKEIVKKQPKSFAELSSNLRGVDKHLVGEYHIKRGETDQIKDWILSSSPRKPEERICLVTGEAGCGKTVIMADLLDELESQGVAVIGLKSDYIFDVNDSDIDKALNLQGSTLLQMVEESAKTERTVLIIDQVDALSLSLTFKRKPLAEIQRVVTYLSLLENVRVVLSCREYDFKSERAFYRYNDSYRVIVNGLNKEDVDNVLTDLNINVNGLNEGEYRFLQNPMNLSLYCRLKEGNNAHLPATESTVYDAYWQQILMADALPKSIDTKQLKSYLESVVGYMIQEQVLSLNVQRFATRYAIEQGYLLSEGYLVQSNDGCQIQFRHQTIFDYTYSRLFFESGRSIEDDFRDVHQGLFVRGRIKTLLVYLRDVAPEQYLDIIKSILQNTFYRFHLKQLVISLLGSFAVLKPQEEGIIYDIIIPDKKLSGLFLRTAYAMGPVKVLIRYIMSKGGFENCEWRYAERILDLLNYIVEQDWKEGVSILRQIDVRQLEEERLSTAIRTICYLPIKSTEMADSLLPIVQSIDQEDGSIVLHHFYANLATIRPDVVAERVKRYVAAKLSIWDNKNSFEFDVSSDLRDMLDALQKADEQLAFMTGIDLVTMMTEASILELENMEIATTSLYWHYNRTNDHFNFAEEMLDSVLQGVEKEVGNGIAGIDELLEWLAHKDVDIYHVIAINGWLKNLTRYRDAAFDYLSTALKKKETSSILEYYQIELFGEVFMLLNQEQQLTLIEIVRTLIPEWEKGQRPITKEYREKTPNTARGFTKGKFLSTIPEDYLKMHFKDAWKELKEIERKGFDIKNEAPNKIESFYGWSTVPTEKLEKMSVDDYVKQAEKYNTDHDIDWNRPTRVGLAWSMRDVLKEEPEKGYEVYKKILENGKADLYYVSSALGTLLESGISEEEITDIYTRLISALGDDVNASKGEVVIDICRSLDYYINKNKVAPEVLMEYVMKVAREAEDNREVDYADVDYNTGINQVRGCAVDHLVRSVTMTPYTDDIFKCLDDIAETASVATRCAALFQMAVMMHGNKEKTLKLFLHLVHDYDVHLLRLPVHSMNPILYLISYNFEALKEYFEHCILKPDCHKVNVVWLLIAALRQKSEADELMYKMADASENGRASLVRETERYYSPAHHELLEDILRRYMNYDEEELGRQYDFIFKEYEKWQDNVLEPYLDTLFDSPVIKYCNHFVFEFLESYSDKNPHKTLYWLLGRYMRKEENWRVFDSMTEVLLTAYNKILVFDKNDKVLEDAMDMLDEFLQSDDAGLVAQVSREIANV